VVTRVNRPLYRDGWLFFYSTHHDLTKGSDAYDSADEKRTYQKKGRIK